MKKMKKEWNWAIFKSRVSPQKYEWLLENHKKTVSEEGYVVAHQGFKEFRVGNTKNYSPSTLAKQYRVLRDTYGFFIQPEPTSTAE